MGKGRMGEENAPDAEAQVEEQPQQVEEAFGIQLYIVAFCTFLCFFGQILIWIKEKSILPTGTTSASYLVGTNGMTLGAYAFMMLLGAIVNTLSVYKKKKWLYWATVCTALGVVLDVNICVNDWLQDQGRRASSDEYGMMVNGTRTTADNWNWELKTGYMCSLLGYVGSFAALPVSMDRMNFADIQSIVGIIIGCWLIGANAAIWSNEGRVDKVEGGSNLCGVFAWEHTTHIDKAHQQPVHLTRAFMVALLHIFVSVFQWEGGQWLTFILASVSISDYMPAGGWWNQVDGKSHGGRCSMTGPKVSSTSVNHACEVGVWLAFFGLWFIVIAHIFFKRGNKGPDFSKLNPMNGLRSTFGLVGIVCTITGMIMVAARNHRSWDENKVRFGADVGKYKDIGAQETYDVFHTCLGSFLCLWGFLAVNNRIGVAGLCFYFSVYNRLLGTTTAMVPFIGACPWQYQGNAAYGIHNNTNATARAGFILLFVGSLLTAFALVNLNLDKIVDNSKAQICGLFVVSCVTFLWSAEKWYGQMGLTAVLVTAFHTFDYKHGLDAAFVWCLLQLPSQTAFTTCEGKGTFLGFVVAIATFGLFGFCYFHMDARGAAQGEPPMDPGEEIADIEAEVQEEVKEEAKAEAEAEMEAGQQ